MENYDCICLSDSDDDCIVVSDDLPVKDNLGGIEKASVSNVVDVNSNQNSSDETASSELNWSNHDLSLFFS